MEHDGHAHPQCSYLWYTDKIHMRESIEKRLAVFGTSSLGRTDYFTALPGSCHVLASLHVKEFTLDHG